MDAKGQCDKTGSGLVQKTEDRSKKPLTLLWNDIPKWLQDNHYIRSGYRHPSNSYLGSAASLGYLHNESVNIWTHLVGAVLAALSGVMMYCAIQPRFVMADEKDVMVFSCFFFGAVGCMGMSATYHTISNHSESVARFGNRLDYMGIILLIWGSFIPSIYYGFSAEPALIRVYWTMVWFAMVLCKILSLMLYRSLPSDLAHSLLFCIRNSDLRNGDLSGLSCSCLWG